MKPESRPSSEQGLASVVNLAGASDHEFTQTDLAKHASFSGSLVAEVSSALHLKRLFDNAGLPTTKPRDSALRAVIKELVGIHVLPKRLLFACDIPRRLLRRVSPAKLTSAPLPF